MMPGAITKSQKCMPRPKYVWNRQPIYGLIGMMNYLLFCGLHGNPDCVARPAGKVLTLLACGLLSGMPVGAAVHYNRVKSFGSADLPGQKPYAGVVAGSDGALYGTTFQGGTNNAGTVFKLNRDGSGASVLHTFGTAGGDGRSPMALVEGLDMRLYGTTSIGGSNNVGTVFKLSMDGSGYTVLHHFRSIAGDGVNPQAGLVAGSDGALYGTTFFGGTNDAGTIFRLNADGSNYGVLHHFGATAGGGQNPDAGLIEGSDKALYGTTFYGTDSQGTVFSLNKNGSGFRVLRDFTGTDGDGAKPDATLMQTSDGALYGTTYSGGSNNLGTVFTVNTNGTGYAVLHRFSGGASDGQRPLASLTESVDGTIYGTAYSGGSNGVGAIFKLNKDGSDYGIVRSFSSTGGDGQNPRAGLVSGGDGSFYGTTWSGGELGFGTVFRLLLPQTPEMLGVEVLSSTVQVRFAGMSGCQYQVLRSTNLLDWASLGAITMPATGTATYVDNAPPSGAAFYRAAWVP